MTAAALSRKRACLLLLDLDGVVVFEHGPPWLQHLEILRLHTALSGFLRDLAVPVVVLTHRSRAEARRILHAAAVETGVLTDVMAAEDLALAALRHRSFRQLFGRGLRKSLILPEVERRHGVSRADMALLDDRLDNLKDLLAHGLGLGLHAPSEVDAEGALITFDTADVTAAFVRWRAGVPGPKLVTLPSRQVAVADFDRTGLSTARDGAHWFNYLRTAARKLRQSVEALRS